MPEKKIEVKENTKEEKGEYIEIPIGKLRENPWIISTFVLLIVLIVMLVFNFSLGKTTTSNAIDSQVAGENAVSFINQNPQLQGKVSLVSVKKDGPFYEATLSYQGREVPVYVTLDGKYLLSGAPVPLDQKFPEPAGNENQQDTPTEVPKTTKPKVELYVMSFCPFGNRAENTMLPVYKLLKDKIDWNIHYIVSGSGDNIRSLHGQKEVDQNARELCVLKNYGMEKLWGFITYVNDNCGSDGSCWEQAATKNGMSKDKIASCFNTDGKNLLKAEVEATDAAGVSGSPTLIINGVKSNIVYQYGNSEAYKNAICSAFTTPPPECSQVLEGSDTVDNNAHAAGCGV